MYDKFPKFAKVLYTGELRDEMTKAVRTITFGIKMDTLDLPLHRTIKIYHACLRNRLIMSSFKGQNIAKMLPRYVHIPLEVQQALCGACISKFIIRHILPCTVKTKYMQL